MNRKRRVNGNLYPLTFEERKRRERRGSYNEHVKEFESFTDADPEFVTFSPVLPPPTTWERFHEFLRRTFGGSPIGGDRLL